MCALLCVCANAYIRNSHATTTHAMCARENHLIRRPAAPAAIQRARKRDGGGINLYYTHVIYTGTEALIKTHIGTCSFHHVDGDGNNDDIDGDNDTTMAMATASASRVCTIPHARQVLLLSVYERKYPHQM